MVNIKALEEKWVDQPRSNEEDRLRVIEYLVLAYGDLKHWGWGSARYETLAECLIDAVFSVRARHSDVDRVVAKWREITQAEGVSVATAAECAEVFAGVGSSAAAIALPDNKIAGRKKRLIVADAAAALAECEVHDLADLQIRLCTDPTALRTAWLNVYGLGHGSWCHLRLLARAGYPDPAPELRRKLARLKTPLAMDSEVSKRVKSVSYLDAMNIILDVAEELEVPALVVEYALMVGPPVQLPTQLPGSPEEPSTMGNHAKVGAAH